MFFERLNNTKVKVVAIWVEFHKFQVCMFLKQLQILFFRHFKIVFGIFARSITFFSFLKSFIILSDHTVGLVADLADKLFNLSFISFHRLLNFLSNFRFQCQKGAVLGAIDANVCQDLRDLGFFLKIQPCLFGRHFFEVETV